MQQDWTVTHGGKWYQLDKQPEVMSLARRKVIVRDYATGKCRLSAAERGSGAGVARTPPRAPPKAVKQAKPPEMKKETVAKKPAAVQPWRVVARFPNSSLARLGRVS